ncbi:hypothetical protein Tco_0017374, partial [Tanacetum coccineum]
YGYIKNHKKTVKNGQARTRESEEYKRVIKSRKQSQKSQASVKSSQQWSTEINHYKTKPHNNPILVPQGKEAQRGVGFALDPLTELAQHVTSKNDMLAILRCPQINPTAQDQYLIIEGIDG